MPAPLADFDSESIRSIILSAVGLLTAIPPSIIAIIRRILIPRFILIRGAIRTTRTSTLKCESECTPEWRWRHRRSISLSVIRNVGADGRTKSGSGLYAKIMAKKLNSQPTNNC